MLWRETDAVCVVCGKGVCENRCRLFCLAKEREVVCKCCHLKSNRQHVYCEKHKHLTRKIL